MWWIRSRAMFQHNFTDFDKFFWKTCAGLSTYCAKPFWVYYKKYILGKLVTWRYHRWVQLTVPYYWFPKNIFWSLVRSNLDGISSCLDSCLYPETLQAKLTKWAKIQGIKKLAPSFRCCFTGFSFFYKNEILSNNFYNIVKSMYTRFFISNTFISNARLKLAKNQANAKKHPEVLPFEVLNFCHLKIMHHSSSTTLLSKNNRTYSSKK